MKPILTLAVLALFTLPIAGCNRMGWAQPPAEPAVSALRIAKGSGYTRALDGVHVSE